MPGKNEFPVGGIFRPKTDYTDQFPLNKAERTELQKNTSRALDELHTQVKGNYEKNTIKGTVKTFDTGYGLRIRDNEGNKIGTAYKGEEVRIIGRQNNVRDSDGIKRNFLRVGVYNSRGQIDTKRSGWVAEDFVEVNPKHIDGLLKNLKKKVEKEDTVTPKKSEKKGSVVPSKSEEEKKGSVVPEKPQRDNNVSVLPPKSKNEKKGSVLPPKKTEVPKGSVPPKESKQDTAEITQASLEAWKHTIEKNTGIEWVGTTTDISPDLNINGKKVAALISLKLDGMTGLYIIDDGKIYNQSPATEVFYISKKIKIEGGKIVKIPVKNTPKTEVHQATPEKSREIDAYRIEGDDTIQSVAQRYGMSENELRKLNKLDPGEVAKSGDELLVWINPGYPLPKTTPEKSTPNNRPIGGETPSDKRRMGEASFSPLDVRAPIPEKTAPTLGFGDLHVREKVEQKVAELEVKNKKDIDTLIGIADDQIKQGKYSEARANLIKILAMDTNNASDHYMYMVGQTYFYENKFDDAIRCFKHVLTLSPSYYHAHNFLGIIAHKKGDMVLAEEELKKSSEMNPKNGIVDYNLAILYASLKTPKTELAKKYYSDALKKGVAPDTQLQKVLDYINKKTASQPIQKPEEKPSQSAKIPTQPAKPKEWTRNNIETAGTKGAIGKNNGNRAWNGQLVNPDFSNSESKPIETKEIGKIVYFDNAGYVIGEKGIGIYNQETNHIGEVPVDGIGKIYGYKKIQRDLDNLICLGENGFAHLRNALKFEKHTEIGKVREIRYNNYSGTCIILGKKGIASEESPGNWQFTPLTEIGDITSLETKEESHIRGTKGIAYKRDGIWKEIPLDIGPVRYFGNYTEEDGKNLAISANGLAVIDEKTGKVLEQYKNLDKIYQEAIKSFIEETPGENILGHKNIWNWKIENDTLIGESVNSNSTIDIPLKPESSIPKKDVPSSQKTTTNQAKEVPKTVTPEKKTPPKENEQKSEKPEKKTENTEAVKEVRNSLGTKLEWTTIEMLKVMGSNARIAYERMVGRARDQESNFIIADKPRGMFYLFNKLGQSLVRIPALYGEQKGDEIPLSAYTKDDPLEKSRNEKVSPAGIFILGPVYHNDYLKMDAVNVQEDWDDDGMVDEEGSMALHPLYLEHPWEKREERIESDTPTDNKVSYGCLNIRQEDFDEWIRPCFGQGGLIAITPDKPKLIDKYIPPYTPTGGTIASSEK